ncbi:MAG: DUF4007 family protein [Endozoicomonadaceae bacterium]|nr:DUF4007 family protein [Endozoicomonadaceae bacterium]
MLKFNAEKMTFGRHETFPLRYGWLSKGFQALNDGKTCDAFDSEEVTVILGVGKNMAAAIKYWLKACCMIDAVTNHPTELGKQLLSVKHGFDPYLEDEATIWLLHWLLATNTEQATSWYWFFNRYHKPEFTGEELTTALADFINNQVTNRKKPAAGTLKNDAGLLPRMYTQSAGNARIPTEESLDSPFAELRLITKNADEKSYQSCLCSRPNLPVDILAYAVCEMFSVKNVTAIPVEDFMYSRDDYPAPGSVFRLTERSLVAKLEKLENDFPDIFEIRETAGMHQLFMLKRVKPISFVDAHYSHNLCTDAII